MRPEWAKGYVDYKRLKKMLKAMSTRSCSLDLCTRAGTHSAHSTRVSTAAAAAGTTHEFSEHTVYKAISVASASNLLQPKAPREADFFAASARSRRSATSATHLAHDWRLSGCCVLSPACAPSHARPLS